MEENETPTPEMAIVGAEPTETGEPQEGEDVEVEIKYDCGLLLMMIPNGGGLEFKPIDPQDRPEFARVPTLTDLNMMAHHLADHSLILMNSGKTAEVVAQIMGKKVRKGGIIH